MTIKFKQRLLKCITNFAFAATQHSGPCNKWSLFFDLLPAALELGCQRYVKYLGEHFCYPNWHARNTTTHSCCSHNALSVSVFKNPDVITFISNKHAVGLGLSSTSVVNRQMVINLTTPTAHNVFGYCRKLKSGHEKRLISCSVYTCTKFILHWLPF